MTRVCIRCARIIGEQCVRCGAEASPLKANSSGHAVPGTEFDCSTCGHHFTQGDGGETGSMCDRCLEIGFSKTHRQTAKSHKEQPEVGIVYWVGRKLWIDSTPVADAGRLGQFRIHERDHYQYWAQLVASGDVPGDEYEEHPRGRVAYDTKSGEFTLLADRCILRKKRLVSEILSRMNLPARGTKIDADAHYRCYHCLGRS